MCQIKWTKFCSWSCIFITRFKAKTRYLYNYQKYCDRTPKKGTNVLHPSWYPILKVKSNRNLSKDAATINYPLLLFCATEHKVYITFILWVSNISSFNIYILNKIKIKYYRPFKPAFTTFLKRECK